MSITYSDQGFKSIVGHIDKLQKALTPGAMMPILKAGAESLAGDVRRRARPRSKIGGTHTHMLDDVRVEPRGVGRYVVGWGRKTFYGAFVETGTINMKAQPHIISTWLINKDSYYAAMREKRIELLGG